MLLQQEILYLSVMSEDLISGKKAGAINKTRDELARMMYSTINEKLLKLSDDIWFIRRTEQGHYAAKPQVLIHLLLSAGERKENYALQKMNEDSFVNELLNEQSYIPKYFGYDVELNRERNLILKRA